MYSYRAGLSASLIFLLSLARFHYAIKMNACVQFRRTRRLEARRKISVAGRKQCQYLESSPALLQLSFWLLCLLAVLIVVAVVVVVVVAAAAAAAVGLVVRLPVTATAFKGPATNSEPTLAVRDHVTVESNHLGTIAT